MWRGRADGWAIVTLAEHYGVRADEQVADVDWIEAAAKQGWPILMKDKRIRHRPAEIEAVVARKARCSVITRGDLPSAGMVNRFVANKAAILAIAAAAALTAMPKIGVTRGDVISVSASGGCPTSPPTPMGTPACR